MRTQLLTQRGDAALLVDLDVAVSQEWTATTTVLELIGEVDSRRLYLSAGYSSMFAYCTDHLHMSEGAAYKRIQAARAAREFPVLLSALAEGRLHLSALCVLRPHLTAENVDELVAAATHRKKSEVEQLVARRFPHADGRSPAPILRALPSRPAIQLSPGTVEGASPDLLASFAGRSGEPAPERPKRELSPGTVETASRESAPPPAERYLLNLTIDKRVHDKLREFQALMSHTVPSGDVAQVLERALDLAIAQAKRSKYAAVRKPRTAKPAKTARTAKPAASKDRHIPAEVRRAVWERDRGRCTFVGEGGHRCDARTLIELDHVHPVARGGRATVEGIRLRCRAHNQFEAERVFGAAFMQQKRDAKRQAALAMVGAAR